MKKLLFAALFSASFVPALALAGPASNHATAQATPTVEPAEPATAAVPLARAAPPTSLDQMVTADFAGYDVDKSGELSSAEFDTWMIAAKKQSGAAMPGVEWLSKAFAKADSDQNKTVSANELTAFLSA